MLELMADLRLSLTKDSFAGRPSRKNLNSSVSSVSSRGPMSDMATVIESDIVYLLSFGISFATWNLSSLGRG